MQINAAKRLRQAKEESVLDVLDKGLVKREGKPSTYASTTDELSIVRDPAWVVANSDMILTPSESFE